MTTVKQIARAVRQLSRDELSRFRAWSVEFDAREWDEQIEREVADGRLDALADEALAEFREGRTRPL